MCSFSLLSTKYIDIPETLPATTFIQCLEEVTLIHNIFLSTFFSVLQSLQTIKGFLADENESPYFGDTSTQLSHILKCYVSNYFLNNNQQT